MSFTGGNGGGDSKGNALWVDGEGGPGEWLWKIEEGSGMWIGVAEEARFGPGYQLKVSSLDSIFVKVASAGVAVRGSWQPLRRLVSCYRALGAKVCDRRQCWHEGSIRVLKSLVVARWRLWTDQRWFLSDTTTPRLAPRSASPAGPATRSGLLCLLAVQAR